MSTVASVSTTTNNAKCPHGFPVGTCPICSGMGGGSSKKTHKYSNPNQTMSYSEMLAVLHRMQANQQRKADEKANLEKLAQNLQNVKHILSRIMTRLNNVLNKIQNILPSPINNLFRTIANNILQPLMNILAQFPQAVRNFNNFVQDIKAQMFVIAEKLASVFSEIKNFIKESLSKSFKRFTKKVYQILSIFSLNSDDDFREDERVNNEIYAFKVRDIKNLKEILFRLIEKRKKEDESILKRHI